MAAVTNQPDSTLKPYDAVHARFFDFTEFEELGRAFMSAAAAAFIKYSSTVAAQTAQGTFSTAISFLRWIKENEGELTVLVSTLRTDYRQCHPHTWEQAIGLWRAELIAGERLSRIAKYNRIRALNLFFKQLSIFGVSPKLYLLGAPDILRSSRPTKTLVEVAHDDSTQHITKILDKALLGTAERGIELQIKRDFLKTLVNETGRIAGSAEEQATTLMSVNANRLAAVRKCAEKDFSKALAFWNAGQRALNECDLSYEEIASLVSAKPRVRWASLFPRNNPTLSLSRLLKYFSEHPQHRGRVMRHPEGLFKGGITKLITRLGGPEAVQAYLLPHSDLAHSIIVLILCDTGANVTVARTLSRECLEDSENKGYKIIRGNKMRSAGKLIVDELPVEDSRYEISCAKAIMTYQKISQPMRELAVEQYSRSLFLYAPKSVRTIPMANWQKWFRVFRLRHEEISHLPIQAKMIRPSFLMQATFENETGIIAAATIGDHNSLRTTNFYVARYPMKMVWERTIRQFQALFQAVSIYSIKGAAQKLGLTTKQVNRLFGEACRTGLGVACLDPKGGLQPKSEKGKTCTQLENCTTCPNRFVVATVENLKDLILFNRHLEQSRREWEIARPEKWTKDWLPWLVFTQVVMDQASRGRTAPEFFKANLIAQAMAEKGDVHLPPLW